MSHLAIADGSGHTLVSAPGVGQAVFVHDLSGSNADSAGLRLDIRDNTTVRFSMFLAPAGGNFAIAFDPPWELAANSPLTAILSGAPTNQVEVNWNATNGAVI